MFDYLKMAMRNDGTEHCTAYAAFCLKFNGVWQGTAYHLTNNYKKECWEIEKHNENYSFCEVVASGRGETLSLSEFKKWLSDNRITDSYMEFLRANEWYYKQYPKAMGVNLIVRSEPNG